MNDVIPTSLSDRQLLLETQRAAASERRATATLLALLAEVDSRRLYLGEGFPSLFAYAMATLHLSEPASYSRITAARASRRFPRILQMIDDGALSLTTVGLLSPLLTDENCESLLEAATYKSKREVERLVAAVNPQPDVPSSIRARSDPKRAPMTPATVERLVPAPFVSMPAAAAKPTIVAPLSPSRYLLRVTLSSETEQRLQRARSLLRHTIPSGDPAAIIDRALTVLVEQLERTKIGAVKRPRRFDHSTSASANGSRRIPSGIRRAVWNRDGGRCAFVGTSGRCSETCRLEFHHVVPFARGGPTTIQNVQLRCRAHNSFESELAFGERAGGPLGVFA